MAPDIRPCRLDGRHPTPVPSGCAICKLFLTNPVWRERWSGEPLDPPKKAAARRPLEVVPCPHRSDGPVYFCNSCRGGAGNEYDCGHFDCNVLLRPNKSKPHLRSCEGCEANPNKSAHDAKTDDPPVSRRRHRYREADHVEWVSTAKFAADAVSLIGKLPPGLVGVAGIPRSGMIPASILAAHLQLPLYEFTLDGKLNRLGHGDRGRNLGFPDGPGPILVIDDTAYAGLAMRRVKLHAKILGGSFVFAAVYVTPEASGSVDLYQRILPAPHLLEWNWANNGPLSGAASDRSYGEGVACDFDGILCRDSTVPDADDGPALETYRQWLVNAKPLHLPRSAPVPLIVTARLERFRPETEAWLARYGVKYKKLVMHPVDRASKRGDVAAWKAEHYKASGCGYFLESDPFQAERIWRFSGLPVICPPTSQVFRSGRGGKIAISPSVSDLLARGDYSTDRHTVHSYAKHFYDSAFARHRGKPVKLLEIGVGTGAGLKLWRDYFDQGKFLGIDVDLSRLEGDVHGSRGVELVETDAYKDSTAQMIRSKYGKFDIVIDDGSHRPEDQEEAIRLYAPLLNPGGLLVIEDVSHVNVANHLVESCPPGFVAEVVDLRWVKGRLDDLIVTVRPKS